MQKSPGRDLPWSILWFPALTVIALVGLVLAARAADPMFYWFGLGLFGLAVLMAFALIVYVQDRSWRDRAE